MDNENMEINNKNKELTNTSNPWFVVSVIVTLFVIILLIVNLFYSFYAINNFESKELPLERISGKLLYNVENLKMTTLLAAQTGDLTWENKYNEHKKVSENLLEKISELVDEEKSWEEVENIKKNIDVIHKKEEKAYNLISQGEKDDAVNLLKSWDYIKNQRELVNSTETLTNIVENRVQENIIFRKNIIIITSIILLSLFVILIFSWYVSIKTWRDNIKKRKEKEKEIIYLNYHDFLTGLYNRRYFMQAGENEIERVERNERSLALMMIDIDHFKDVNDTYGHAVGDKVLKNLANILKDSVREIDIVGRLGGEEFGIILPDTNISNAEKTAERLRKNIEDSSIQFEGENISVTVSIGVSSYTKKIYNMSDLLHEADIALYKAKDRGRNCVHIEGVSENADTT
ncbi:MAG: GGDEF domain-containing protein [bacterium]